MTGDVRTQMEIYEAVWRYPEYREVCHSANLWHHHPELFPPHFQSALDIGCGLGRLFAEWNEQGIDAWAVDHVDNCLAADVMERWRHKFFRQNLWRMDLGRCFEFGICADVMEHIPEVYVLESLYRISVHCDEVLFKIANFPSRLLQFDLHPTRRGADWWLAQMETIGGTTVRHHIGTVREEYIITWKP